MKKETNGRAGLLSTMEAAQKLGITPRTLRSMASGKHPRVHAVKITNKLWLWHWPTITKDLGFAEESRAA